METLAMHRTIAASLFVGLGLLGVIVAALLFVTIAGGGLITGDAFVIAITGTVATVLALLVLTLSLPGLIGGAAVLRGVRWGRPLLLIAAAMSVFFVPVGTILGIYTLIVLALEESTASGAGSPA